MLKLLENIDILRYVLHLYGIMYMNATLCVIMWALRLAMAYHGCIKECIMGHNWLARLGHNIHASHC